MAKDRASNEEEMMETTCSDDIQSELNGSILPSIKSKQARELRRSVKKVGKESPPEVEMKEEDDGHVVLKEEDQNQEPPKSKHYVHHFFNYEPDNLLAVHSIAVNERDNKVAVLRKSHVIKATSQNFPISLIEIWNFEFNCAFIEQVIREDPSDPSFTEDLVWTRDGRLLSVGLNEKLIEYDLIRGRIAKSHQITSGPAYCIKLSADGQHVVIGTDHGFLCIFSLYVGNTFEVTYERSFRTDLKVFCLDWYESGSRSVLIAGTLNQIKLFDFHSGQSVDIIQIPQKNVNVWSLSLWPEAGEFVLVSGLSNGTVAFWDCNTCTQIAAYTLHTGDVTSTCVRSGGRAYSVGIDGKMCRYRCVDNKIVVQGNGFHVSKFDLKKICSSNKFDCLFFGGSDTELKRTDASAHLIRPFYSNLNQYIQVSGNLLMYQMKSQLEVFRLPSDLSPGTLSLPTFLGTVTAKAPITASALSQNYICYATNNHICLIRWTAGNELKKVKIASQPKMNVVKLVIVEPHLYAQTANHVHCYHIEHIEQQLSTSETGDQVQANCLHSLRFKHRIHNLNVSSKHVAVVLSNRNVTFYCSASGDPISSIELDYLPLFTQWKSNTDFWFCLPNKAYGVYSVRKQKFRQTGELQMNQNEKTNQKIAIDGVTFSGQHCLCFNRNKIWAINEATGQVTTLNQYKDIVQVTSMTSGNELCVVELPFETMIKNLPPIVYRKRYRLN
jgi:WD40 repeat protein